LAPVFLIPCNVKTYKESFPCHAWRQMLCRTLNYFRVLGVVYGVKLVEGPPCFWAKNGGWGCWKVFQSVKSLKKLRKRGGMALE